VQAPHFPFPVIEKTHARARYIRVSVNAAGEVLLTIPRYASKAEARGFLASRVEWVLQQRAKLAARGGVQRLRLAWDGEDRLPLRGADVPLHWTKATLARPQVRLSAEAITVFAPGSTRPEQLARALKVTLMREARLEAEDLLNFEAHRLGVQWMQLRIGDPRTQWGSCTRSGDISLSWRLLLAPPEVFRYVVIHELCHLPHPDHSPRFWALVAQQMPAFSTHRDWLKRYGAGLHRWLPARAESGTPQQDDLFA
jgi:predicted metal-dependent hydrolase